MSDDPREARRQQILMAAMNAFMEKGYEKTSMDDIVRASGLSKGTLYWYFANKQALFAALVTMVFDQYSVAFEEAAAQTDLLPPPERLRAMLLSMNEFMHESPEVIMMYIDVLFQAWKQPEVRETLTRIYTGFIEKIKAVLDEGVEKGHFRPVDTDALAKVIAGATDGVLFQRFMVTETFETASIEAFTDFLLESLRKG